MNTTKNTRILHNPRCSKSRQALELLRDKGIEPEVIEYLKTPPEREELEAIIDTLGIEPRDLIRRHEALYKELDLDRDLGRDELIDILVRNPKLIERPIVLSGNKAAIGRPPEKILDIL
jgi:arsenate reductase